MSAGHIESAMKKRMLVVLLILLLIVPDLPIAAEAAGSSDVFVVYYHSDLNAAASGTTTAVTYGTSTKTKTVEELGFTSKEKRFLGWRIFRELDQTWRVKDSNNIEGWAKTLPSGYSYVTYGNGCSVAGTVYGGENVHFYATWDNVVKFTVRYHDNDNASAASTQSEIYYGYSTPTLTYQQLGFSDTDRTFKGWKVYRESDNCWAVKTSSGDMVWSSNVNADTEYYLYGNGETVAKTAPVGTVVHFYGQWVGTKDFTIKFHPSDSAAAISTTQNIRHGVNTKTYTSSELGITNGTLAMRGWKVYREYDKKWRVLYANGEEGWATSVPEGGSYQLYGDGCTVAETAPIGTVVHFYAQWAENTFTVKYHRDENSSAHSTVTTIDKVNGTRILSISELGFQKQGSVFLGWKAQKERNGQWLIRSSSGRVWSSTYTDENIALVSDKEWLRDTAGAGDTVHLYAVWSEGVVDVTASEIGAKPNDGKDDYAAIQKALNLANSSSDPIVVYLPAGEYHISRDLGIYSDTTLWLDENAVIIRTDDSCPMLRNGTVQAGEVERGGYERLRNVVIRGGKWDGNVTNKDSSGYGLYTKSLFFFYHGENITVTSTELTECCGYHFIELAGVKDVTISDVYFHDFVKASDSDGEIGGAAYMSETIQLDFPGVGNADEAVPLDGTPCKNVTVTGCTFRNVLSGVGNHHIAPEPCENVVISGNTFSGLDGYCVVLAGMSNGSINNNTATDVHAFLMSESSGSFEVYGNNIRHGSRNVAVTIDLIDATESDLEIRDNVFVGSDRMILDNRYGSVVFDNNTVSYPVGAHIEENALYIYSSDASVRGNTISNAGWAAIRVASNSDAVVTDNVISETGTAGIYITDSLVEELSGNRIDCAGNNGMRIENSTVSATNNVITNSGTNGIYIKNVSDSSVSGNEIVNAGTNGIYILYGELEVRQNTIIASKQYGIVAYGNEQQLTGAVTGNTLTNCEIKVPSHIQQTGNTIRTEAVSFTIKYHETDTAAASATTSEVIYGYTQKSLTAAELGFIQTGKKFRGWKVYREYDGKWYVKDANGKVSWATSVPSGGSYALYVDGETVARTGAVGTTVHFYAQWDTTSAFTIKYYQSEDSAASDKTSSVTYGVSQASLTVEELGFGPSQMKFVGWRVFRDYDNKWYVKDANGSAYWATSVPSGGSYALYRNGESVGKTTVAGTTAHFYAQWEEINTFTVKYHQTEMSVASAMTSEVTYGVSKKTYTIEQLGFSQTGMKFLGWKVHREYDNKWYVKDASGSKYWATEVPSGGSYALYVNGESVGKTAVAGTIVHFYGQWEATSEFTVKYYKSDNAEASPKTSTVTYGVSQKTLTISELGFAQSGKRFVGWKVYRDYDNKWYVKDASGSKYWATSVPSGGSYALYVNGESVGKTTVAGTTAHFYAQWEETDTFVVKYHKTDTSDASDKISTVTYGVSQKTLTVAELGFTQNGKRFVGWKVYRDYDNKWYVKDASGSKYWATSVPSGGSYALYVNGESVGKTTVAGTTVHFYAQWENATTFTVKYYETDNSSASAKTSTVTYGVSQKTLTISELGFVRSGKKFVGWKVYRDYDNKWYVKDASGSKYWATSVPSGGSYALYVNGESVGKTTVAGTTAYFYAQWEDTNAFTVKYHETDNSSASAKTSTVTYGVSQKTLKTSELGFAQSGKRFVGWKVYRDYDNKWYVKDKAGNSYWATSVPSGGGYSLYVDGESVGKTTVAGTTVHFYAQWENANTFTIKYYQTNNASASPKTSVVTYGVSQKTLTISELGFAQSGKQFVGWRVYRDYDNKWYVKDKNGNKYWATSVPAGGSYALYVNGESVGKTTVNGTTAYFYAQWE